MQAWTQRDHQPQRLSSTHGIANSWIDTTRLKIESQYSDADDVFGALTNDSV